MADPADPNEAMVSSRFIEKVAGIPTHEVLCALSRAAQDSRILPSVAYKKVLVFVLEEADGRDRREPWLTRPGDARPIPRLRLALEECYGVYADVHWFNLNKTANRAAQPLVGLFPRMAAMLAKVKGAEIAAVVTALMSESPDAALLRMLQQRGGRIPGIRLELFSRLAFAHRRDLFFTVPKPWGDTSGCVKYIGDDLRKYCELCRNLRSVCDELGIPAEIRGSVLDQMLREPYPSPELLETLNEAIGPSLAQYKALEPNEAWDGEADDDASALPTEFAMRALRARRGGHDLRMALLKRSGDHCSFTGACPRDLLEVAYIMPFPTGEPPNPEGALLVRSDLHALFDLNLIGIEADTLRVYVAATLAGTSYDALAGSLVDAGPDGRRIDRDALRERWRLFVSAHPNANSTAPTPEVETAASTDDEAPEVDTTPVRRRRKKREVARRGA